VRLAPLLVAGYVLAVAGFTLAQPAGPLGPPAPVLVQACGTHCGTERWAVKTLTDADTGKINPNGAACSIVALRQIHAPLRDSLPENGRVLPTEGQVCSVTADLLGWKLEADSDLHLVIADPSNHRATMIAEIPASGCDRMCASPWLGDIVRARQGAVAALGKPSHAYRKFTKPRPVGLVGVLFFDFIHGQTGVAPNGIELHPVLVFQP